MRELKVSWGNDVNPIFLICMFNRVPRKFIVMLYCVHGQADFEAQTHGKK